MNKHALRAEYIEKRKSLSISDKLILEEKILHHVFSNFNFLGKLSSCYLPIVSKNEFDTWKLITQIQSHGGKIALTVWDTISNSLGHRLYTQESSILLNSFNIPEPVDGDIISDTLLDFVFVPLLVVDRLGTRVGYGKGVYDRFLRTCSSNTVFIGLSFFELIDKIEDTDFYDVPLHYCITPNSCIQFEK